MQIDVAEINVTKVDRQYIAIRDLRPQLNNTVRTCSTSTIHKPSTWMVDRGGRVHSRSAGTGSGVFVPGSVRPADCLYPNSTAQHRDFCRVSRVALRQYSQNTTAALAPVCQAPSPFKLRRVHLTRMSGTDDIRYRKRGEDHGCRTHRRQPGPGPRWSLHCGGCRLTGIFQNKDVEMRS